MRQAIELEIPLTASNGAAKDQPPNISGASHVHVGGIFAVGEQLKVQYITDRRFDAADAWTDGGAGTLTGVAATWVKLTEDIPAEALAVRIVSLSTITPDTTYPPIARWIYDEDAPA